MSHTLSHEIGKYAKFGLRRFSLRAGLLALLFLVLFGASAWVRFEHLDNWGISGNDEWEYVENAVHWANGNHTFCLVGGWEFYRPAAYLFNGLSIRLFGAHDTSLKRLNVALDLINILLVCLVSASLSKNPWVALGTAVLYAFLPVVVEFSLSEMPHTIGTTFVLLALFAFCFTERLHAHSHSRIALITISAFSAAFAAHTHIDLVLLAPTFVSALFLSAVFSGGCRFHAFRQAFADSWHFALGFFLASLIPVLLFGFARVIGVLHKEIGGNLQVVQNESGNASVLKTSFHLVYGSLARLTSGNYWESGHPYTFFVVCGAVIIAMVWLYRGHGQLTGHVPFAIVIVYALGYGFSVGAYDSIAQSRVFLPLLPVVLIGMTHWYYKLSIRLLKDYGCIPVLLVCSCLFMANGRVLPGSSSTAIYEARQARGHTSYHEIHAALKGSVDSSNRLLVAPYTARHNFHVHLADFGLRSPVYFGNNAVYMNNFPKDTGALTDKSLKRIFTELHIRYLLIKEKSLDKMPRANSRASEFWPGVPYELQREINLFEAFAVNNHARLLVKGKWGRVYEFTQEPDARGI